MLRQRPLKPNKLMGEGLKPLTPQFAGSMIPERYTLKSTNVPFPNLGMDSDKDGVPNEFDCEPYNKKKQGILHDAANYLKRKVENVKEEYRGRRDASAGLASETRERVSPAYHEGAEKARYQQQLNRQTREAYQSEYLKAKVSAAKKKAQQDAIGNSGGFRRNIESIGRAASMIANSPPPRPRYLYSEGKFENVNPIKLVPVFGGGSKKIKKKSKTVIIDGSKYKRIG